MTTSTEQLRKRFEVNMLDGESIDDCGGAMLSAKEVYEYFAEEFSSILAEKRSEIEKLKQNSDSRASELEVSEDGYVSGLDDVLSILSE